MLFMLISCCWLAVIGFVGAVCRAAAVADGRFAPQPRTADMP
jgi:hypothetical protein